MLELVPTAQQFCQLGIDSENHFSLSWRLSWHCSTSTVLALTVPSAHKGALCASMVLSGGGGSAARAELTPALERGIWIPAPHGRSRF